ncbi:alpha/beta fold hydrolase [Dyella sp. EPa41]|uniref:alpha/beta hydrolase family protein n=1 Tax=Dyella sp. EPa41 TaxID=1561194 RepID=UPI0019166651|nr:alpha/beta fold hydrolase [Dyella sp. EPa41]
MSVQDDVVHVSVRGGELAGTLVSPRPSMPGVLMVHGWGGSQEQYQAGAKELAALGCVCLTFDLSGHVATRNLREVVTRADNLADVLAAYDFLLDHPVVDRSRIAVIGSSYGGYLAALLTRHRPVRWLGLRAPALYRDDNWEVPKKDLATLQNLADYRREHHGPDDNEALRACSTFEGDLLLVESQHDRIVPSPVLGSYRDAFRRASSLTYRLVRGADHALSAPRDRQAYSSLLAQWLEEMVLGARGHVRSRTTQGAGDVSRAAAAPPT